MSLTLLDVVGHASFALTALSFYVRDMMVLRALAIVAGLVGVGYNYWLPVGPLWLVIFWLSVFVAINAVRIIGIVLDRRAIDFNEEESELHETVFQKSSPVDFMKLMRIGEWRMAEIGERLTAQGQAVGGLKLLYNGEVVVERDSKEIGRDSDRIGDQVKPLRILVGGRIAQIIAA